MSLGADFGRRLWAGVEGIAEGSCVGFDLGFRRLPAECGLVLDAERRGRVAGGLGEVGGRIPEDFGGASGSGSLWKEEPEVGCFWVDVRGGTVVSLAGNPLELSSSLLRINPPFFSLSPS